jgi:translocator assembly and maintenance protein 41
LLLLPEQFSYESLFVRIASLSYLGDFRMHVGENPRKVQNIVTGNLAGFVRLYEPILAQHTRLRLHAQPSAALDSSPTAVHVTQDTSRAARHALLAALPASVREPVLRQAADGDATAVAAAVQRAVGDIVGGAAWWQSVKGLVTAGAGKSLRYAWEKVQKKMQPK